MSEFDRRPMIERLAKEWVQSAMAMTTQQHYGTVNDIIDATTKFNAAKTAFEAAVRWPNVNLRVDAETQDVNSPVR
jgi:hypothetical protein